MGNWSKVLVLLIIISLGFGLGGYFLYKNKWVKPRAEISQKREELNQAIEQAKKLKEQVVFNTTRLEPLYTRSFPLNKQQAGLQYQIWLSQMLEFCNIREPEITLGEYKYLQGQGVATQAFSVRAKCQLIDLTQFLYEFYWTPFLQRISTLDIAPQEGSDLLDITMNIEGLTIIYRANPNQTYPLPDQLPLATAPPQQLASGPFAAYKKFTELDTFRAVKTGIDATSLTTLTALPVITDELGHSDKFSRWNLKAENKSISLQIGDEMKSGSFVATIVDIDENMVILKQSNGLVWAVTLGMALSEAAAVPANLF